MSKLSAPILENILPAISINNEFINIPFTYPKDVVKEQIKGFQILIRSVINNNVLLSYKSQNENDIVDNFCKITVTEQIKLEWLFYLKEKSFYKLQLCFLSKNENGEDVEGYYSNAGVFKLYRSDNIKASAQLENNIITFTYNSTDLSEKLNSYYFEFLKDDIVYYTSDIQYHNSKNDLITNNEINASETISLPQNLNISEIQEITLHYETTNKIKQLLNCNIIPQKLIGSYPPKIPHAVFRKEQGSIVVTSRDYIPSTEEEKLTIKKIILYRSDSKSNFQNWVPLKEYEYTYSFDNGEYFEMQQYIDNIVEHGVTYQYSLQAEFVVNSIKYYTKFEFSTTDKIKVEYEDIFLSDGEHSLAIKYNPDISSFKTTILEQKQDTIGGKTPYFFRNKNVSYKEFQIKGTISYLLDDENSFEVFSGDELDEKNDAYFFKSTNLTFDNIAKETEFKLKVMDWLQNGKPKVFRSPYEGNYIIRLMNVSLSPQKTTGRMIHDFSATAYEIMDYNYENLFNVNTINLEGTEHYYKEQYNELTNMFEVLDNEYNALSSSYIQLSNNYNILSSSYIHLDNEYKNFQKNIIEGKNISSFDATGLGISVIKGGFFNNSSIQTVNFPDTKTIESNAFEHCSSLQDIKNTGKNASTITINEKAFYLCINLSSFSFQQSYVFIGAQAFENCYSLVTAYAPELRYVTSSAFKQCESLKNINFSRASAIFSEAFYGCKALESAHFEKCTQISTRGFFQCRSLSSISFPECTEIGLQAFGGCENLTEGIFPKCLILSDSALSGTKRLSIFSAPELLRIESYAFANCYNLTSFNAPKVTSIGAYAFWNCSVLKSIYIESLESMRDAPVFQNCELLSNVSFPNLKVCNIHAFGYCQNLTNLDFPNLDSLIGIWGSTNWNTTPLKTLSFGKLSSITSAQFAYCSSLEEITLPSCINIGESAFYNCENLKSITLATKNNNQGKINYRAFGNCYNLSSINLNNYSGSIGTYCFSNCSVLSSVALPISYSYSIPTGCFMNCISLSQVDIGCASQINQLAFKNTNLQWIKLQAPSVCQLLNINAFEGISNFFIIQVPSSLYNAYINDTNWGVYSAQFLTF